MGSNKNRDLPEPDEGNDSNLGLHTNLSRSVMGVILVAVIVVLIALMLLPSLGKARNSSPQLASRVASASLTRVVSANLFEQDTDGLPAVATDRKLIRTASINLRVDNIETAARDAIALLIASDGEYASELRLVGSGGSAQGSLTLRVRNERLDAALDALQALGQVEELSIASQDVTETLIDLAARLRNERRIEAELLELMDSRSGDELKQVLELRRELGRVRESIERLDAKQVSLARRVELATVHLSLFGHSIETRAGFWGVTGRRVGESWSGGLDMTSRTLAGLIEIAVGSSLWWVALVLGGTVIWRFQKRKTGALQTVCD